MKDKFFELGRQATIWCCGNLNPDTPKQEWDAAWEDKFGELIVRDCISQIAMVAIANYDNDDVSWAIETCIDNIKARYHLGVKDDKS